MKIIKDLKTCLIAGPAKSAREDQPDAKPGNNASPKTDSLAYLAYKNRKQKGLVGRENQDIPTIFFGDEWAF